MPPSKNDELMTFSPALMAKWEAAADKASRDFRSDVVTVPTPDMMQAILEATVNDDIYDVDGDPSVKALETKLVELTGKESALWAISGTQGNQICLRTHLTQPPHTVLLDYRAHVHCWESGALPVMSQASATTVHPKNGVHLTLDDVKANMIADGNIHFPPTRVVSLENTLSGTILPLKDAQAISEFVRSFPVPEGQKPVAMHLDAARLFDGVIGEGVDLKAYAACFDSLSICLAKGIGAPMGSVILGSKQFIERAKWFRKMFGGGTRQPGMMAAAALEALNYTLPRMSKIHALTKETADKIEELGYKFALPVQTNMIVLDLAAVGIPAAAFVDYCAKRRLAVFPNGRVVLHHQSTSEATDALVIALTELMRDKSDGKALSNAEVHGGYS
ncbi:putative low-specificity L-threonine aldolase [Colletotrichum sp. SAR11_59]|uniref:Threonine aldolase n=1 Tax=Colletotrichum asianum TaxID=702518 RepID=A0A8H3ZTG9_9PEZI|nr:threonine aldolase [Colletotrichum asianum]KAI8316384.1 putative low-specificity L-threonine aldolase [Colletotrichum sp. SAR11_59]